MKLLLIQFSPVSCPFLPFGSKYSSQQPVLKQNSIYILPLNVRDHVSHPNKTTGKIMVLYIRIYDDDFFVLHCNLNSILLILCHLWQGSSFCDKFSETQYDTKLYKQKTINIQADYFQLHSHFSICFHIQQFPFIR